MALEGFLYRPLWRFWGLIECLDILYSGFVGFQGFRLEALGGFECLDFGV